MDSRLFMEIGVENTTFQAIDKSPYERWINDGDLDGEHAHAVIQRLIATKDGEDDLLKASLVVVADTVDKLRNSWEVSDLSDGLYYYQKLLLPTQGHTTEANETLWFDEDTQKVVYYDVDSEETTTYDSILDFEEIYNIVRKEYPDNCFYFDDRTFTIYSLVECYVLTERERISNYLKNNCREVCAKNSNLEQNADILLAAIMVINNLIDEEDFFEAQRILNGLNTCNGLCKNKIKKGINDCGCGGA